MADLLVMQQMGDRYEKELLKSRLEVQEQTFDHLSRELHDSIGSAISIARAFNNSNLPSAERTKHVEDLLSKVIFDLRNLSKGLGLEVIKADGLTAAIEGMMEQLRKLKRFEVHYELVGNYNLLDEEVEIITFRILQESINNIIRHADATQVEVVMICTPELVSLHIRDNGKGFDTTAPSKAGGLRNMKTRAALIDATIDIENVAEGGTEVRLSIRQKVNSNV